MRSTEAALSLKKNDVKLATDDELIEIALGAGKKVEEYMEDFKFNLALEEIWVLVRRANKYIDETAPWVLAKDEDLKKDLDTVLHNLAEALRIVSVLIYPFMHTTSAKIREQLGIRGETPEWQQAFVFEGMAGRTVSKGEAIFPRLDIEKEMEELAEMNGAAEEMAEEREQNNFEAEKEAIEFDDFEKIDLRVGTILEAEKHPKADKLLVFKVDMGYEVRQIISGVAEYFKPEDCVGRKVVVVANLKPRKLRGMESKGMLLFAEDAEGLKFVSGDAENGSEVC